MLVYVFLVPVRYIRQFREIFTEEGRRQVKITHIVPNKSRTITYTQGFHPPTAPPGTPAPPGGGQSGPGPAVSEAGGPHGSGAGPTAPAAAPVQVSLFGTLKTGFEI